MRSFQQLLADVSAFFQPENLAKQYIKYEGEVALVVIDVQKEYCDPKGRRGNPETEAVSERIQSLIPEFRKAGIPVYAVYFSCEEKSKPEEIDFYKFSPEPDDTLVRKNRDSAFKGSNIREILRRDNRKLLLTCGFNLSACVASTVQDARSEGFDVCLLHDLTGNDNENPRDARYELEDMKSKGVTIEQSANVLSCLRASALTIK